MPGTLVFIDVEAAGASPVNGVMTEFGAVHEATLETFHGVLYEGRPDPANPAIPVVGARVAEEHQVASAFRDWVAEMVGAQRPVFVSDNPAFDWQWIAAMFDRCDIPNPFGHSGRRLGDFWAGLRHDWRDTQGWKEFRVTPHDHHPVNDAMGNVEAYRRMQAVARELRG